MRITSSRCRGIAALLVIVSTATTAQAQHAEPVPAGCASAATPSRAPGSVDQASEPYEARASHVSDTGHAALRIVAAVSAEEVRFVGRPRSCVQLTGDARLDSLHVLARRNIGSPVVSNTTYRDVYVAVELIGRLNAECISARIVGTSSGMAPPATCARLGGSAVTRAGSGPP